MIRDPQLRAEKMWKQFEDDLRKQSRVASPSADESTITQWCGSVLRNRRYQSFAPLPFTRRAVLTPMPRVSGTFGDPRPQFPI